MALESPGSGEKPLASDAAYKQTVVGDYVVPRTIQLFRDRFVTYQDIANDPGNHRAFPLDATARLVPADAGDIQRKRRHIRPQGVGSMTALAALRGAGQAVELWTFKLESDATTDFKFCFSELAQAQRWHELLARCINDMRAAAGLPPASPGHAPQSGPPSPSPAAAAAAAGAAAAPRVVIVDSSGGGGGDVRSRLAGDTFSSNLADNLHSSTSHMTAVEEEEQLEHLLHFQSGIARNSQRWVPYRHSNGLAIYQHRGGSAGSNEYMVSAIVRGSPLDVLRGLLDPASATTILGPALEVEVLDSKPGRQVLRIQLHAVGPTAAWFRPREAVVQRLLRKEEDGVYVLLFSSVDSKDADAATRHEGVLEVAEGMGTSPRLARPVRCRVSGGYTISKLSAYSGDDSPESLITCILQVEDMGGWLNPNHVLFGAVNYWSGGAYQAFVQRMLMGVTLVKDVVEKSRFAVKPLVYSPPEEAAAAAAGADAAAAAAEGPLNLRSSTFVLRRAAAASSGGGAGGAARGSPFASLAGVPLAASVTGLPGAAAAVPAGQAAFHKTRLASQRLSDAAVIASLKHAGTAAGAVLPEAAEEGAQDDDAAFKLPRHFYSEIHTPGADAPFKLRGPNYLSDGHKVPAGPPVFELLGMEAVDVGGAGPMPHISRYLPCVRRSPKPFLFVYNLMVPGPPTICCVFVFGSDSHPDTLGPPPDDPEDCDWEPFDFLAWRFLHGDDEERRGLFKMLPHIAEGSWLIRQSVGTTPVIIGRKLTTSFHVTRKYVEVAVDVGSSTTAQYVTGLVRGGAKSLVIDLGLVLEGQHAWELPEVLLGAVRVHRLDLAAASKLDTSREVPILDVRPANAPSDWQPGGRQGGAEAPAASASA